MGIHTESPPCLEPRPGIKISGHATALQWLARYQLATNLRRFLIVLKLTKYIVN